MPLPDVVRLALAEHISAFDIESDGLLFTGDEIDGQRVPLARSWFSRRVWVPARAQVRKTVPDLPADAGMHELRHVYASLLIRHGESVKVVQDHLGHATAAETLDTYAGLWPDSDDQKWRAVDSVLGAKDQFCWGPGEDLGDPHWP